MNTCAFALLNAELPQTHVSMSNALKMLSCVKVAAVFLQCSADRTNAYSVLSAVTDATLTFGPQFPRIDYKL